MTTTKIYFIRCGEFVKIGKAKNPFHRKHNLQIGSPFLLELLGWFEAEASEEQRLHQKLLGHHVRGEWFRWCDEIEKIVATLNPPIHEPKERIEILSARQCLAARAGLQITGPDLARMANITRQTLSRFERGRTSPNEKTATRLRTVFEEAGVAFPNLATITLPEGLA